MESTEAYEIENQVEQKRAHQRQKGVGRGCRSMVDDVAEQPASDHHHAIEEQHTPIGECIFREVPA